jgi:hypothetical protein
MISDVLADAVADIDRELAHDFRPAWARLRSIRP